MPDSVTDRRNLSLEAAAEDAARKFAAGNPKSAAAFAAAARHLPGANTRTVLHYDPFPVQIADGQGASLTDIDGHIYTDYLGEYTAGLYGHSHPVITAAIEEALAAGLVLGGPNRWERELAALMVGRFPSVERVRFTNSGTESNLMALALACAVTGRGKVLVFDGAYHGGVFYFAGGGSPINAPYDWVLGRYNDPAHARDLIRANAGELAAVVVEPMTGAGGCIPGQPEFLQTLRDETAEAGVLLIFDEVMTSRLAPGGMQESLGISPDLTTFGKYLGGGVTFGAFGGRADLMDRFDPTRPDAFPHAGTYNNNALTMAAGVAGLSKVFTDEACKTLNDSGDRLRDRLNEISRAKSSAAQVTGLGSVMNIHFQDGPIDRAGDTAKTPVAARKLFHLEMLARGFYLARRGFMSLSLALTEDDHDRFAAAFEDVLGEYGDLLR